jgi:hypothetical protein
LNVLIGTDARYIQEERLEAILQEPQYAREEQLVEAELCRTFLLDPDLSLFGRGASDAAFSLGQDIAVVGKKAGGRVWELMLTSSNEFYQSVVISGREPLRQTATKIEAGVCESHIVASVEVRSCLVCCCFKPVVLQRCRQQCYR